MSIDCVSVDCKMSGSFELVTLGAEAHYDIVEEVTQYGRLPRKAARDLFRK